MDLFPQVEGVHCDRAAAPTGEPFTVLCGGPFSTRDDAVKAAYEAFDAYAAERKGATYWRIPPEVVDRAGWRFYMRLLISDKEIKT